ncbi:MAG TPA: hypothetical protein VIZ18_13005 [Ktedonobacteraceae bacterium]
MHTLENEEKQHPPVTPDLQSHPLLSVPVTQEEDEDDPEQIFLRAVAEIDTQPLVPVKRKRAETALTLGDVLEMLYLLGWACFVLVGSIYLAATVPHTLVIVYARTYPAAITTTLDLPTRALAPVTVTRSQTVSTTGQGYQEARAAMGLLTAFNGSFSPQSLSIGTVLVGRDGIKVATTAPVTVPAAQPPQFGQAQVPASALTTGNATNIAAGDITLALSGDLLVKNLTAFSGGRDARTYRAVAPQDLQHVMSATLQQVRQVLPQAFLVRAGEGVSPAACTTHTTADHAVGAEATTLTVIVSSTCQGIAYRLDDLSRKASAAFLTTRPGAHYHLAGRVQTTIQRAEPLVVSIVGHWTYTFSPDYQEALAEHIAGATPSQARNLLLHTGVIVDATLPGKLPPDGSLIDLLVITEA